ncbi:MAG: tRNA guanosine(34) transglycosylase Tgt [Bdellovibrionia bacterium]
MSRLQFQLEAQAPGSRARAARFQTLHGEVLTPVFMPVGTQATVKCQTRETLLQTGAQVLLANTYHLMLRPGIEVFRHFKGIHSLMKWERGVLTDSGGYQIFSLPHGRKMTEEGALFKSYVDGKMILLSPELSIEMQKAIGSDIMMVLDQCVPSTSERSLVTQAMHLTERWAVRSFQARGDSPQSLFGIVQGGCFEDLRRQSAEALTQIDFDGFAIGGLAVGETKAERYDFTELSASLLPHHLPRYLMGVGTPLDLLEAVHRGVDLFDCILPTALAQRGVAFTRQGKLQLRRKAYQFSEEGLDPQCSCQTCQVYSKGYLHHLVKTQEPLGWQLIGIHNLSFYHGLMAEMRQRIFDGSFLQFYQAQRGVLDQSDGEPPVPQKKRKRSQLDSKVEASEVG